MSQPFRGSRPPAPGDVMAWILHPVTVGATVALLVNDHLLKAALPGPLTGKLSDIAGLVVAPPLLALLLALLLAPICRVGDRLVGVALGLTGLGFAVVKSCPSAAVTASRLWSVVLPSRVVADRTDLFVLPALAVSWWVWTRVRDGGRTPGSVRRRRAVVVVPLVVWATAATAGTWHAYSDVAVGTQDGSVIAVQTGGAGRVPAETYLASQDGGMTWRPVSLEPSTGDSAPPPLVVRTKACVPAEPLHCYRAVPGKARVEETDDGGARWSVAWELSAGRMLYLRRTGGDGSPVPRTSLAFTSTSLVVAPVAGGHTVIVADQNDGLVVRDPAGHWSRRGLPTLAGPKPLVGLGGPMTKEYLLALSAAWLAVVTGACAVRARREGTRRAFVAQVLRIAAGLAWLAVLRVMGGADREFSNGRTFLMALIGAIVLLVLSLSRPRGMYSPALVCVLLGAAVGTGTLTLLPFLGWTVARPDSYTVASTLSWVFLIGALAGTWALAQRITRPRAPRAGRVRLTERGHIPGLLTRAAAGRRAHFRRDR